jgi:hypothetical protein
VKFPALVQVLLGAAASSFALLIPYSAYLASDGDMRPPFIFDDNAPNSAILLVVMAMLIMAAVTLAPLLRPLIAKLNLHHPPRWRITAGEVR